MKCESQTFTNNYYLHTISTCQILSTGDQNMREIHFSFSILENLIKLLHIHASISEKQYLNKSKKKRGNTFDISENNSGLLAIGNFKRLFKSVMCFGCKVIEGLYSRTCSHHWSLIF